MQKLARRMLLSMSHLSLEHFQCIVDVEAVHGHGGRTRIMFLQGEPHKIIVLDEGRVALLCCTRNRLGHKAHSQALN